MRRIPPTAPMPNKTPLHAQNTSKYLSILIVTNPTCGPFKAHHAQPQEKISAHKKQNRKGNDKFFLQDYFCTTDKYLSKEI